MPTQTKIIMVILLALAAFCFSYAAKSEEIPPFGPDDLVIQMTNVTLTCWIPKSANDHQQLLCHFDARSIVTRTTSFDAQAAKALIESQRHLKKVSM